MYVVLSHRKPKKAVYLVRDVYCAQNNRISLSNSVSESIFVPKLPLTFSIQ